MADHEEEREAEELPLLQIKVHLDYDRVVNFALQHNEVPVIKRLRLENTGPDLPALSIEVTLGHDLAQPRRVQTGAIPSGQDITLDRIPLVLDMERLKQQEERESCSLKLDIHAPGFQPCSESFPLDVLAANEWSGSLILPEILAAFVLPNSAAVNALLAKALRIHETRTRVPRLSAYQQDDRSDVMEQVRSLYETLAQEDLGYVVTPASFEEVGQKIRLPDQILKHRLGNCLDLSLLAAALMEQAGLNPIIVVTEGHAFCGAWTRDMSFQEAAMDDVATLRKRTDLEDIVLFESTTLTQRPLVPFHTSRSMAREQLNEDTEFGFVVDIHAARKARILPLPGQTSSESRESRDETIHSNLTEEDAASLRQEAESDTIRIRTDELEGLQDSPVPLEVEAPSRMNRWQRRLLDLSLRNRLLNFRSTKKNLTLLVPDLGAFEDALQDGLVFALKGRPTAMDREDPRAPESGEKELFGRILSEDLSQRIVHGDVSEKDAERRLLELYRASRNALEETGSNSLYLALGFLQWFENEKSTLARLAPLMLIPMQLTRKSAADGFRLRRTDDEARINTTLLEKLKQDFSMDVDHLAHLPEDDHGIDVPQVLQNFRKAVVEIPRWDVLDSTALGLFSFNKFLMWADLATHSDSLLDSPVVRHLVETPQEPFEEEEFPELSDIDTVLSPGDILCPLDADSSQLRAVLAASAGRTFVLQGPPGTGKSQTITNLIAHALARGQRILFVAEKMAALNVVHARLSRLGLESACLELHSNKTSKSHVLDQLRQALEQSARREPADWQDLADDLGRRREELNAYVAEIHARHAPGLSVYQATARLAARRHLPSLSLDLPGGHEVQRSELDQYYELVDALATAAVDVGSPGTHQLAAIRPKEWSPRLARAIEEVTASIQAAITTLRSALDELAGILPLPAEQEVWSPGQLDRLEELAALLLAQPGTTEVILTESPWSSIRETLEDALARGRACEELRSQLAQQYSDELLALDVTGQLNALQRARASFPPISWVRTFLVKRSLRPFARGPLPDTDTLVLDLGRIQQLRRDARALDEHSQSEARILGHFWRGSRSDWGQLAAILKWAQSCRQLLSAFEKDTAWSENSWRSRMITMILEESESFAEGGAAHLGLKGFQKARKELELRLQALDDLVGLDRDRACGQADEKNVLQRLEDTMNSIQEGLPDLRRWCHWQRLLADAGSSALSPVAKALEEGRIEPDRAVAVFEKSFLEMWLNNRLEASTRLRRFNSRDHERRIRAFARLDERLLKLNAEVVKARISSRLPSFSREASAKSEVGILQRQMKLKRRHMPIRKLFQALPDLLPRLKPCLLMSPLSVAQYLSPDYPKADLVIFDEASQIPVWDAIGALARGHHAVIVGDSRQLPPTTFFRSQENEDDLEEDTLVAEVESILDECEAGGLPSLHLGWHYRSRHEDLIAFSNHHYYDNKLMTFPASNTHEEPMGVSLVPVPEGVYDRSSTRTNKAEAQAVVDEVTRRLLAQAEGAPPQSLGVVAFSRAQQEMIEDLLDVARRRHPAMEVGFEGQAEEPVFVKNLENVQGDERDVILFSICYGPNAEGRVSMNFGPLNREGGERRLNVAITRARKQLIVFSTLRPEQIDLSRSRAVGVAHLRSFLEYADRGHASLPLRHADQNVHELESPLIDAIAEGLQERGHKVVTHVGHSTQPIDLAICDPDNTERFLLGIECDGTTYSHAATARDRDRLRQSVLRGLGWKLCRVWSSDWLQDPERELDRLEAILHGEEEHEQELPDTDDTESQSAADEEAETREAPQKPEPQLRLAEEIEIYRPTVLEVVDDCDDPLFDESARGRMEDAIRRILKGESPISHALLCRRLMAISGLERLTGRVRNRVRELVAGLHEEEQPASYEDIYFRPGTHPDTMTTFRTAALGEVPRQADDIHPVEIANAARRVLEEQIALPVDDMPKECARMLGFPRLGSKVKRAMERGIEEMLKRGWAVNDEGQYRLPPAGRDQSN